MARHSWWKWNTMEKYCRACGMKEKQLKLSIRNYVKFWFDATGAQVHADLTPPCVWMPESAAVAEWIARMTVGQQQMAKLTVLREKVKDLCFDYRLKKSTVEEADLLRAMGELVAESGRVELWFTAHPEYLFEDLIVEDIWDTTQRFLQIGTISMDVRNGVKTKS